MMRLTVRISSLVLGLAAAAMMSWGTAAQADIIICQETASGGCVAAFPPPFNDQGNVASDGELPFDPFHAGFDTSDGVQFFSSSWIPDPAYAASFGVGLWTQIPGTNTWVLPAIITGCGAENEPSCEPVGGWFLPGAFWVPSALGTYDILDPAGNVSDRLIAANNGPNGNAGLTFASDPIPEPTSIALLGLALAGLTVLRRRGVV